MHQIEFCPIDGHAIYVGVGLSFCSGKNLDFERKTFCEGCPYFIGDWSDTR